MSTFRVRIIQMSAHFVYTQKVVNGLPSKEKLIAKSVKECKFHFKMKMRGMYSIELK